MDAWATLGTAVITAVFSAGSVWGVVRIELRYLRRDVDRAHDRIDQLERRHLAR